MPEQTDRHCSSPHHFDSLWWWLLNDPRSRSEVVCCDVIAELGKLHHGRKWFSLRVRHPTLLPAGGRSSETSTTRL